MVKKFELDKKSVRSIQAKLKSMPAKMQRTAIRKTIDPEAKMLKDKFKSITPIGKRNHKNKYGKRIGKGFLKRSFSVRNSGRGQTAGRSVVTTAQGYYIFMSPNQTGRKAGSKKGVYRWGSVQGAKKYSNVWNSRQTRVTSRLTKSLGLELSRL